MEDGNLKVGEFVRFEQVLCKIDEIEDNYISFDREFYDHWADETMSMNYNRFINDYKPRHNKNIIELLEPGDYVNGWKITTIDKRNNKLYAEDEDGYLIKTISKKNIKSIVTKESFNAMEYNL